MSKTDKEFLLELLYRSLDSELTSEENEKLQEGLRHNPDLEQERQTVIRMRSTLKTQSQKGFAPGFADRVLTRLQNEQNEQPAEDNLFSSVMWSFRRVALIGAASILFLAFNNFMQAKEVSVDSLFALPTVSLENTIALNSIYEGEHNAE